MTNYITVTEAAARLGVVRQRIDQFIRQGRLPVAFSAGRVRLIDPTQLEKIPRYESGSGKPLELQGKTGGKKSGKKSR